MKRMFTNWIIASSILVSAGTADNNVRNVLFSFNNKQYTQTRIKGIDNTRNAIKINNMVYFGTSRGIYVLPNDDMQQGQRKLQ